MTRSQIFFMTMCFVTAALGSGFEMTQIPSGRLQPFWLTPVSDKGSSEKEVKKAKTAPIRVRGFRVMKYPVTISQFGEFLKLNPGWAKENVPSLYADESYLDSWATNSQNSRSPITHISWFAARAFCEFNHMRLPTVNEWEYMAAASETKRDANKDERFLRRILDWYGEPRENGLKPVGSIYQNIYGVWDLHGLIWEWVEDFNSSFVTGESREDSSFNKNMFCGAGAMSGADKENYASFMRFAFRSSLKGRSSAWNLGFRCVAEETL